MNPSVSVIIPAYNAEKYIEESIESVFAQSYQDFEIIVIDDGSTDRTPEVLDRFGEKLRVVRGRNRGPSGARNIGISVSRGKYVAFLDSDDLWTPDKLAVQVAFLERHSDIGMVFADMLKFNARGVIVNSYLKNVHKIRDCYDMLLKSQSGLDNATELLLQCNLIPTGSVLVRKDCLERAGLFDENLKTVEDLDLWLRLSMVTKFGFVPRVLKHKREHDANVSSDFCKAVAADIYMVNKFRKEYCDFNKAYGGYYRRRLSKDYFYLGSKCLSEGRIKEARGNFAKSLKEKRSGIACMYLLVCLMPVRVISWLKTLRKWRAYRRGGAV
jgi:glycosyltransferase involved in cell wall biosynthesis